MIARVFHNDDDSLLFALEKIKDQIDKEFGEFDFLLLSIHPKYGYEDVNYLINKIFKTKYYAAFNAVDMFKDSEIVEGVNVVVFKFEGKGDVDLFYLEDISKPHSLTKTAEYLNKNRDKLNIIIGSLGDENLRFGAFIEKLSVLLDYSPIDNIIGGISSGEEINGELVAYQYVDGKVLKNGFIILSFDNVNFKIGMALGFKPYGISYHIKEAKGYRIYSVDDGKKFSYISEGFLKGIEKKDIRYLWYTPIYLLDEEDGYIATLRTFSKIEKDYVEFFGPVKTNQTFKLSFASTDELLEEDKKNALEVKKSIQHPDFIFNFSCIARQYVLEEKQKKEIEIYTSTLNAHLFGFFTFGEIGPDRFFKKLKLYNETSLLLAMEEK